MRKTLLLFLVFIFASSTAFAAWQPTLLKLSADPEIQYDFGGTPLEIPVTVSGTDAEFYYLVYTKGIGSTVPNMQNGYLGWHQVCKIDTCIYVSPKKQYPVGINTFTWDGKDNDGNNVSPGEYTYYMWAFDNVSPKNKMCNFISGYDLF